MNETTRKLRFYLSTLARRIYANDVNEFEEWRLSVGGNHVKLIEEGETDLD